METKIPASASRRARERAAIERWALNRLAVARRATARAVREPLAAGRPVVFEKDGTLFVKTGPRVKVRPWLSAKPIDSLERKSGGFAEMNVPKYSERPVKMGRRKNVR